MEVMVDGKPKLLNSRYTNVWVKGAKGWHGGVAINAHLRLRGWNETATTAAIPHR
jgi:hypothetical protein